MAGGRRKRNSRRKGKGKRNSGSRGGRTPRGGARAGSHSIEHATAAERVWLGGCGPLDMMIRRDDDGALLEAEWALWVEVSTGPIGFEVEPAGDAPRCAGRVLRAALDAPASGAPRRPDCVRVATHALADEARAVLGDGVRVEVAPTPELDEIAGRLVESLLAEGEERSYLEEPGVDAALVAAFFAATRVFASAVPWVEVEEEDAIGLDVPQLGVEGAVVAITGYCSEPPGFVVFPDREHHSQFASTDDMGTDGSLVVGLIPRSELSDRMMREIDEHGWLYENVGMCPVLLRIESENGQRSPSARDYRLATAVADALTQLVGSEEEDGSPIWSDEAVVESVGADGLRVRLELLEPDTDYILVPPDDDGEPQPARLTDEIYQAVCALDFLSPRARRTLGDARLAPGGDAWLLDGTPEERAHLAEVLSAAERKGIGGEPVAFAAWALRAEGDSGFDLQLDLDRAELAREAAALRLLLQATERLANEGEHRRQRRSGRGRSEPSRPFEPSRPSRQSKRGRPQSLFVLRVALRAIRPPIWRRIEVCCDITLAKLHEAIQDAMGWTDSHLHAFERSGVRYGVPDREFAFQEIVNERRVRLDELLRQPKQSLDYEYDFGDGWRHRVVLEKILPLPKRGKLPPPRCTGGRRACPPEDCGGPWGYANLLEALSDAKHPEHAELREWVGGRFDPEAFEAPDA